MNPKFSLITQRREARAFRLAQADMESILNRVLSMSEQEKMDIVRNFVKENGSSALINKVKGFFQNMKSSAKTAQALPPKAYRGESADQLFDQKTRHADQLQHKLKIGDWIDLVAFIVLVGVGGAVTRDMIDIFDAFLIASGAGFMTWLVRLVREWANK